MSELTVVVCTLNGAERLDRFLRPLAEAAERAVPGAELLVVDDGSTDTTVDVARRIGARVVSHDGNRGWSAAHNTAMTEATGDWVLFVDDDASFAGTDLGALWQQRRLGSCLVPVVMDAHGWLQNAVTLEWKFGDPKFVHHDHPVTELAYPMGTCFMVHASDYWRAGGCDERIRPLYFDDTALGWRLRATGTKVIMVSDVKVLHDTHGGDKSPERAARNRALIYMNRWKFVLGSMTGWLRVRSLILGFPRVLLESVRVREIGPARGYVNALAAHLADWRHQRRRSHPPRPDGN